MLSLCSYGSRWGWSVQQFACASQDLTSFMMPPRYGSSRLLAGLEGPALVDTLLHDESCTINQSCVGKATGAMSGQESQTRLTTCAEMDHLNAWHAAPRQSMATLYRGTGRNAYYAVWCYAWLCAQASGSFALSLLTGAPRSETASLLLLPPSHSSLMHLAMLDRDWLSAGGSIKHWVWAQLVLQCSGGCWRAVASLCLESLTTVPL